MFQTINKILAVSFIGLTCGFTQAQAEDVDCSQYMEFMPPQTCKDDSACQGFAAICNTKGLCPEFASNVCLLIDEARMKEKK